MSTRSIILFLVLSPLFAFADDFDVVASEVAGFWFYGAVVYLFQILPYLVGITLIFGFSFWALRFLINKIY